MADNVDLYGTAYGNFATRVLGQVRGSTYDVDFGQSSWVTAEEYRRFFALMKLTADDHVLDVGSGSGGPALFLAREVNCRVTGVDINGAGIAAGLEQARAANLHERVHFRQADVSAPLPFADGSFTAIVCMDVLCHLPARGRLFAEWQRVLQPGGRALVTDPVVVTGLVTKDELAV
ncbi:MAG: cyclopropane-fatty-acyl-phospholipid synthase family protein, partial [Gemmataceae bacterium]